MAEQETLAQADAQKTQSAEEDIADFLFGPEQPEEEFEYEPSENAQVEGDDEEVEASEEETEEEEGPQFVEVEYDGKLYEVPTELKDALLRQSDYTTKTQDVAKQRKEVELQFSTLEQKMQEFQFAESIQGDVLKAQQLDQTANQYHEYLRNNIDNLSSTDIEKLRMAIEDSRRERDELVNSVQGKQQRFQQAQQQSYSELLNKGTEVLKSKIPGWGEEHQKQVRHYANDLGFTDAELNAVVDPREVEVLWKASQYDALQKGKTSAVKKVQEAPTIKARARDDKGRFVAKQQKQLQSALKSKKVSDYEKAQLIGGDIASRMFNG